MSGTGTDSVSGDWTLHLRIDGVESAGSGARFVSCAVAANTPGAGVGVPSGLGLGVGFCGVVYAGGTLWLGLFARTATGDAAIGLERALATGVVPFVLADVTKLLLAAAVVPGLWRIVGRRGR